MKCTIPDSVQTGHRPVSDDNDDDNGPVSNDNKYDNMRN